MTTRYATTIREAEKEITRLEPERDRIDTRIQHLQDFIRLGKLLNDNAENVLSIPEKVINKLPTFSEAEASIPTGPVRKGFRPKKGKLIPGSLADHVCQVMREAGKPLRLVEIIEALRPLVKLRKDNPWANISSALNRHPKTFKRIRPGVYTLKRGW